MGLFTNDERDDLGLTIIVGCGRLGAGLADALSGRDGGVVVIDKNSGAFRKLSPHFDGISMPGDGTDLSVLAEAGAETATTLLAVTDYDNTNIMTAQLAKEVFHIKRVIARLYNPEKECAYRDFGIDTVCPDILSFAAISKLLCIPESDREE